MSETLNHAIKDNASYSVKVYYDNHRVCCQYGNIKKTLIV